MIHNAFCGPRTGAGQVLRKGALEQVTLTLLSMLFNAPKTLHFTFRGRLLTHWVDEAP